MGVDQPGQHQPAARLDHLGASRRQAAADGGDQPVLDQDVGAPNVADLGIHRDHPAISDKVLAMFACSLDAGGAIRRIHHTVRHAVTKPRSIGPTSPPARTVMSGIDVPRHRTAEIRR